MEFRVLGPIELWSAGQPCDLGAARARSVLAILLLAPGTIVPAEVLIERVWDTQPPPKARESLSVYITRLRASLRQAVGDGARLAGRARGYQLDVDPDTVNLHQFRRLRRQADALAANGDCDHAAALLREADRLWRGPALAGIGGDWVTRMRDGLHEERRAAVLKRIGCDLELGRHADLVGELQNLLGVYPLDEAFIAHQMTALYGSGRAGDALSLYRDTRSQLIEEQGTEPGPGLAELHQRILGNDPRLAAPAAGRRGGQAAQVAQVARTDPLPPEAAQFVGRDEELRLLTTERDASPPVKVIEGVAGVGKTALAVQAARAVAGDYPDGIYYLSFHSHDPGRPSLDAAEALDRLLRMLTAPATQIPEALSERAALLRAQLSRRRAILILDDAAHLDQLSPLLPQGGQCLILITTRRTLPDLDGARALTLDGLPMDDAITLFQSVAGRSMAHDPGEAALAVQLCGRLPLAIQLAAGRLAQDYPPRLADLVEELSRSRPGWTAPARPPRTRYPRATCPTVRWTPASSGSSGGWPPARAPRSACTRRRPSAGPRCPTRNGPWPPCIVIICWTGNPPGSSASTTSSASTPGCGPVRTRPPITGRPPAGSSTITCTPPTPPTGPCTRSGAASAPAPRPPAPRLPGPRLPGPRLPASGEPGAGLPGRGGPLAGVRMAQYPAGRAVRGAARMETEMRRPHPRAGWLHGGQGVLG